MSEILLRPARVVRRAMSAVALALVLLVPSSANAQRLTGAAQIARAYDAIFDAAFDSVPELIAETCPPAPVEVCRLLEVQAIWWRIQVDPADRSRDAAFRERADTVIAEVEAWTRRDPQRAEAWFYLGGAYGARAQWRVLRGERLAAARDGKRIKTALERALTLEPSMADAWAGIGLYHYYAAVAPAALKMLRWLLLLPGGDRVQGLEELERGRSGGALVADEADYQLHLIDLWYEKQPARAVERLRALRDRHPRNPHFRQLIADLQEFPLRDFDASRRSYQELLDLAVSGSVTLPGLAETQARLGVARLAPPEEALVLLREVIARAPATPVGALSRAHLQMGEMLDRLGRRTEAIVSYRNAIATAPRGDPLESARAARGAMTRR